MTPTALLVVLIGLSLVAYAVGKSRALAVAGGTRGIRNLHSLPSYYGTLTALWCIVPALIVLALWVGLQDAILVRLVSAQLPEEMRSLSPSELGLVLNDMRNVIAGNVAPENASPAIAAAAAEYIRLRDVSHMALAVVAIGIGILGMLAVRARIAPQLRARNSVERIIEGALMACSLIAVLTTVGIIASVIFEAARFFNRVPWHEFLFGLH
ncbi:MAG TPA: phosphate ABC transporter permease family protein, partial [Steroidobacteraceae bacterium]